MLSELPVDSDLPRRALSAPPRRRIDLPRTCMEKEERNHRGLEHSQRGGETHFLLTTLKPSMCVHTSWAGRSPMGGKTMGTRTKVTKARIKSESLFVFVARKIAPERHPRRCVHRIVSRERGVCVLREHGDQRPKRVRVRGNKIPLLQKDVVAMKSDTKMTPQRRKGDA